MWSYFRRRGLAPSSIWPLRSWVRGQQLSREQDPSVEQGGRVSSGHGRIWCSRKIFGTVGTREVTWNWKGLEFRFLKRQDDSVSWVHWFWSTVWLRIWDHAQRNACSLHNLVRCPKVIHIYGAHHKSIFSSESNVLDCHKFVRDRPLSIHLFELKLGMGRDPKMSDQMKIVSVVCSLSIHIHKDAHRFFTKSCFTFAQRCTVVICHIDASLSQAKDFFHTFEDISRDGSNYLHMVLV